MVQKIESQKTEFQKSGPEKSGSRKSGSRKYDTLTLNELLLRIFGEEHRHLIQSTLVDLDCEYEEERAREAATVETATVETKERAQAKSTPAVVSASRPDPFKTIGEELRGEERLAYLEAFER